jgi:hypothetical protein
VQHGEPSQVVELLLEEDDPTLSEETRQPGMQLGSIGAVVVDEPLLPIKRVVLRFSHEEGAEAAQDLQAVKDREPRQSFEDFVLARGDAVVGELRRGDMEANPTQLGGISGHPPIVPPGSAFFRHRKTSADGDRETPCDFRQSVPG